MNKSKFAALFLALLGLAASGPAAAQMRFYVGASMGTTQAKDGACNTLDQTVFACDRSDTNRGGEVGLMFNPNWGVEVGYRDLRTVLEMSNAAGDRATWKTKAGDAVVVAALPFSQIGLGDSLTAYAKAGGYYAKTQLASTGFLADAEQKNKGWTWGVGLRYNISRFFGVRAEWQRYINVGGGQVGLRTDVDVVTGGIVIGF